jgi:diphthine synthase
MVESSSDDILKDADKVDVAFLVVGDPFGYASSSLHLTPS